MRKSLAPKATQQRSEGLRQMSNLVREMPDCDVEGASCTGVEGERA